MNIAIKSHQKQISQSFENQTSEFGDLLFAVKNNNEQLRTVKEQTKETIIQFAKLQKDIVKSKQDFVDMFEEQAKKQNDDFVKFNDRQSSLEVLYFIHFLKIFNYITDLTVI